jgi:CP family cyanate transporter-like MFS transporter
VEGEPPGRPRLSPVLLAAGVILVAINLRPAAASIGPVLDRIQSDTGLSSGWAGALTTLPVLCFGLLAPLAPPLARRLGVHRAIAAAMVGLLAGMVLRLVPGTFFLFAGTALAGASIATGNVLLPVIVRRDFPERTGTAMAAYTTSLVGFAALSAGVTVPLADALGGGRAWGSGRRRRPWRRWCGCPRSCAAARRCETSARRRRSGPRPPSDRCCAVRWPGR